MKISHKPVHRAQDSIPTPKHKPLLGEVKTGPSRSHIGHPRAGAIKVNMKRIKL